MADNKPEIDSYGNKYWYQNGELHRTDGPAIERTNGDKVWCQNGKYHCTYGPAMEYASGGKYWFINGNEYSFKKWLQLCSLSYEEQCELVLTYG